MRVLALDISTSAGWCLLEGEIGGAVAKILDLGVIANPRGLKEMGVYPWNYLHGASLISAAIVDLVGRVNPDEIVIEETNVARAVYSQKVLEFIHCFVLVELQKKTVPVKYITTRDWRKALGIQMTKADRAQNVKVRRLKRINTAESKASLKEAGLRGKMTQKHLAIRWVNQTYGLELRPKDDDKADAVCLASSYMKGTVNICDGTPKRGKK